MRERAQHNGRGGAAEPPTASDEPGRPLFGRWPTAIIAALLIGPFAIAFLTSEEPFPSVMLPRGAGVVKIDDGEVTFGIISYVGYDANGDPHYLDITELFDPVPPSHTRALARSQFGQNDSSTRRIEIDLQIRKGAIDVPRHVPSEADQLKAREWINDKLVAAGLVPDRLELWRERVVVDYDTGAEISRELTREEVILDR